MQNPWIRHIRKCASMYQEEKAARAQLPRRRLNSKMPEEALYKRAAPPPAPEPQQPKPEKSKPAPIAAASGPELTPKERLQRYVAAGRALLEMHQRVSAADFAKALAKAGPFRQAMEQAGHPTKAIVASFVKAFPQFKLESSAKGGASYVTLA